MSAILEAKYRDQLATWIDKPCYFRLMYKISRDGCSAQKFHQKCDCQGPTVTVLYNTNNTIYGGYLSQSWNSSGDYINDGKAFLFRLQYNGSSNPQKFPVKDSTYAGYGRSDYGPTFGSGHDIHAFSGTINKSGNYFSLNGYTNKLGNAYDLNGQNCSSITNNSLQLTDLEVYEVKDDVRLESPWRKFPEFNKETMHNLKKEIVSYATDNVPYTNILLIGQINAGKSSFFNSANSTFCEKITSKACVGSFEHSLTTMFRKYTIKDHNSGQTLKLRLCDTRGLEEDSTVDPQDIAYILDGNVQDRYQFNPSVPLNPETLGFVHNPELADRIHCVAFVVDGSTVDVISEKIIQQIKALQIRMNQRNIPQVVYLTKLDKVCPKVDENVKNVFYSAAVQDAVDKVADVMGLPRGHVLPIKNYERETSLDPNIDLLVLNALKQTINFAGDYIDDQIDKMRLMIERSCEMKKDCCETKEED